MWLIILLRDKSIRRNKFLAQDYKVLPGVEYFSGS